MKRTIYLFSTMLCTTIGISAQESSGVETTLAADVVSQYIWRGQECGNVSIQPTLGIEYNGLSLSAWGSVGTKASDTKEFDLTLGYTIGKFNIGVTDYWFNEGLEPDGKYFKYKAHSTNHLIEANVGVDLGHVNIQWFTNITGNDGTCSDGKRAYSSYFEIGVPFSAATVDWNIAVGAVPYSTDFYDVSRFAITNIALNATKEIRFTDTFALPIFGQIVANPRSEKAYFIVGFTLQP